MSNSRFGSGSRRSGIPIHLSVRKMAASSPLCPNKVSKTAFGAWSSAEASVVIASSASPLDASKGRLSGYGTSCSESYANSYIALNLDDIVQMEMMRWVGSEATCISPWQLNVVGMKLRLSSRHLHEPPRTSPAARQTMVRLAPTERPIFSDCPLHVGSRPVPAPPPCVLLLTESHRCAVWDPSSCARAENVRRSGGAALRSKVLRLAMSTRPIWRC